MEIKTTHNELHGETSTRLYRIYTNMKQRCNNPNADNYSDYGGRGITVCKSWTESYIAFADWARSNGYEDDLTIDRIDNDGNYEPENCRWVTWQEQAENKSRSVKIEYNGETLTFAELSRRTGIHRRTLRSRYESGDRESRLVRAVQK